MKPVIRANSTQHRPARTVIVVNGPNLGPNFRPDFATRVALLYAAIFVLGGIQLPFFPLWLNAKGLDERMIGVVLAAPMAVRIVAIPLAARIADRYDALPAVLGATAIATVAGYVGLGLTDGAAGIAIVYALASLVYTPVLPLTESYALRGLAARGRSYGPVRLWGSVTFIVGTFAAGIAADLIPPRHLIWLVVAASVLIAVAAMALEPVRPITIPAPASGDGQRRILRDPAFLLIVAAASLVQASHAVYYGFSVLAWTQDGFDGTIIAALWALGVIAEIVLFAGSGRLPLIFTPSVMLTIGAAGAVLRWIAMAMDPPAILLPVLQLLHALSFGATHLGALSFVARHAAPGQGARAQGYLAVAQGAVMAAATGVSGWLYGQFGTGAYAAMALAAVAGGACALSSHRTAGKLTR
jgi:PPP family 3-phenylpropionic acid transporter